MTSIEKSYQQEASQFLEKLFFELNFLSVDHSKWDIDHLCFRTESLEHYEKIKNDFTQFSICLIESPVNGRPIATYKLKKAWQFGSNLIDLIEVPAPKPNKITKPGFEHIEVVMPKSFEEIQKTYPTLSFEKNENHKVFNPELVANLESGDIKFHHQSLEAVINIEKLQGVLENIQTKFNFPKIPYFICGTLPLGLNNPMADIDVAVSYKLNEKAKLLEWIQNFQDETISPRLQIKNDVMVFNFKYENRIYEFYMSSENLFVQNAYRHMNIEMRLLKIFGEKLKEKIKQFKQNGLTTEYAFLKALGIYTTEELAFSNIYHFENLDDSMISCTYQGD